MTEDRRIVVGVVAGAHGVRGELKIKSFTPEPARACVLRAARRPHGHAQLPPEAAREVRGLLIARIDGSRTATRPRRSRASSSSSCATCCRSQARRVVPRGPGRARGGVGRRPAARKSVAVQTSAPGDVVEIAPASGPTYICRFSKRVVPEVDIAAGRIVVDPPAEVEVKPEGESTTEAQRHREDRGRAMSDVIANVAESASVLVCGLPLCALWLCGYSSGSAVRHELAATVITIFPAMFPGRWRTARRACARRRALGARCRRSARLPTDKHRSSTTCRSAGGPGMVMPRR